jgi:hypothetical protein
MFREQVRFNEERKAEMARARAMDRAEGKLFLREIQTKLGTLDNQEAGVLVDLMLSYRAVSDWLGMIELYETMPVVLQRQVLVREQLAFALNRRAGQKDQPPEKRFEDRQKALGILEAVLGDQGPSPETLGLRGRIYKDLWEETCKDDPRAARGYLKKAIDIYRQGFEADSRDAYPGVNAVTLLDIRGTPKALQERDRLLPVVCFAVEQRLKRTTPDYWDLATMLELSVLRSDDEAADEFLDDALAAIREDWEPETTARNLRLIRDARADRNEDVSWLGEIIDVLENKAR